MSSQYINPGVLDPTNPEAVQIMRRQKMAEQLLAQGQEPLNGQMVSGHYVAPSWTQYLAKGLNAYLGAKGIKDATDEQQALAEKLRAQNQEEISKFTGLLQGKPAITLPEGEQGPVLPAQAPDMNAAMQFAAKSQNPMLQQFGLQSSLTNAQTQMQQQQAEKMRLKVAQMWQAAGGDPQKALAMGMPADMVKQFAESKNFGKEKGIRVGDSLLGEYSGSTIGTAPNPNKPFNADGTPNHAFQEYELKKAEKSGTKVSNQVSVAGPENKYNQQIGEGLAKDSLATIDIAKAAPEVVNNARSIKAALDAGAMTGTGAETRLAVQKAAETMGLVEPGKAATTQQLMSGLSKLTLSGVKTSGLGAGNGFTDKDREFLNAAISGSIADTPANLRRVADLSERIAIANHAKGAKLLERWNSNKSLSPVAQDVQLDPLPQAQSSTGKQRPPLSSFER